MSKEIEPETIAICACYRVDSLHPSVRAESTQQPCVGCGHLVWVAKSSESTISEKGFSAKIMCLQCLFSTNEFREAILEPPSEAQIDDILTLTLTGKKN